VEFVSVSKALGVLGLTDDEKQQLYRLLAALLHLGNVSFVSAEPPLGDEQGSRAVSPAVESAEVVPPPNLSMAELAGMLGLDAAHLQEVLTHRYTSSVRGEALRIPLNANQSKDNANGTRRHAFFSIIATVYRTLDNIVVHVRPAEACVRVPVRLAGGKDQPLAPQPRPGPAEGLLLHRRA
jgi:myosin heavy subunit